ncbi:MAG: amino acid permease [Candidatus Mcinerneyibacterium aminivorans]|uniref:Amino acid permease n=1 Tax=Candidatus Mcinerneyibacterium aminivorans TaxID=2703815 RepID=A0A5D0MIC8_9BACT|nr:MAG: amino acid permease [Candidatus Mcinerneyibacterium aminivorans]
MDKNKILDKSITFLNAFSIAAGAMISSGLFVLPAVVYRQTGPSIILVYLVAGILMLPTMMSQSELATAMPKAGGAYFYIMRILGPQAGFIAGVANWFSIAMKSAFALVGIGTFLTLINPDTTEFHIRLLAAGAAVIFTLINLFSTKHSSKLQTFLLIFLLIILSLFIIGGYPEIKGEYFSNFFTKDINAFFAAVGAVFISFGGLTKIASMSEEIKDSAKNVPKAMFFAFFIMIIFYLLVITVVVGLLPHDQLVNTLTPISTAAKSFAGNIGVIITSIAAMLAFVTTANAGIMSASRAPLAMSRDGLIPEFFSKISSGQKTPYISILFTGFFMTAVILGLRIESLVKVASAFMLILFIMDNLSLIIIRNINLRNYKPTFKAPLAPYLQITAIIFYLLLLNEMGHKIMFMALIFIILSLLWYYFYARKKTFTQSALIMLVDKIMDKKLTEESGHKNIEEELFEILQQRNEIEEDFFDKSLKNGMAFDIDKKMEKDEFFKFLSSQMEKKIPMNKDEIYKQLCEREKLSTTNISEGLAIPHMIIPGKDIFELAIIRAKKGINWHEDSEPVKAVFVLLGSIDNRELHLKSLMAVAQLVQNNDFFDKWLDAQDEKDLKSTILLMPRNR